MLNGIEDLPPFLVPAGAPAVEGEVDALEVGGKCRISPDDIYEKTPDALEALVWEGVHGATNFL